VRGLVILLGAVVLGLVPAPALGGVATTRSKCVEVSGSRTCDDYTLFRAARGEANHLIVTRSRNGRFLFRDTANPVVARGRCRRFGEHAAVCAGEYDALVYLGDGDDFLRARTGVDAWGGEGDDTLIGWTGGPYGASNQLSGNDGNDYLQGGNAPDDLNGGAGRDKLVGRGGPDHFVDGETDNRAAPDIYDGGTNESVYDPGLGDGVDYDLRRAPLEVDLSDNAPTAEDQFVGIEDVATGSGDDRLTASATGGYLFGGAGDDALTGSDAVDYLSGGTGADVLTGGAGDDRLMGYGQIAAGRTAFAPLDDDTVSPDQLACGEGTDTTTSTPSDTLAIDCEQTTISTHPTPLRPAFGDGRAIFRVQGCPCQGRITFTGPAGEDFGRGRLRPLARLGPSEARVTLTAAALAALPAGVIVRVAWYEFGLLENGYQIPMQYAP
jgi:hypothetical protein